MQWVCDFSEVNVAMAMGIPDLLLCSRMRQLTTAPESQPPSPFILGISEVYGSQTCPTPAQLGTFHTPQPCSVEPACGHGAQQAARVLQTLVPRNLLNPNQPKPTGSGTRCLPDHGSIRPPLWQSYHQQNQELGETQDGVNRKPWASLGTHTGHNLHGTPD